MTVSTTQTREQYNGNGVTKVFPVPFPILKQENLKVYLTYTLNSPVTSELLEVGTDYTVVVSGQTATVTLVVAPLTGTRITIWRQVPYLQLSDLLINGVYNPQEVENTFDRQEFQIQQLVDDFSRALKLPPTTPVNVSSELPLPEANKFLQWNPTATALRNTQLYEVGQGGSVVIPDGSIQTNQLANKSVTVPKLNDDVIELINELSYDQSVLSKEWVANLAYLTGEVAVSTGVVYEALEDIPANEDPPPSNPKWYPKQTSGGLKAKFIAGGVDAIQLTRADAGLVNIVGRYTTVVLPLAKDNGDQRIFFRIKNSKTTDIAINITPARQEDVIAWFDNGVRYSTTNDTLILKRGEEVFVYERQDELTWWEASVIRRSGFTSNPVQDTTNTYLNDVTYTNTSTRAFLFTVGGGYGSGGYTRLYLNESQVFAGSTTAGATSLTFSVIVPPGATFKGYADGAYTSRIMYIEG